MDKTEFKRKVRFVTNFGRVLHSVGTPAHTLEATMQELCRKFGLKGEIVSLPTAIFSSFTDQEGEEEVTKIHRVEPVGVNLGKLSQVDMISREVISGQISYEDGIIGLENIVNAPDPYGKRMTVACFLLSAIGFLVLFGGNWGDLVAVAVVGTLMGLLSLFRPLGLVAQLFEAIVAMVAALSTYLMAKWIPSLNVPVIILSGLIIFMPGLNITIAISEIATYNLTSGTSRLVGGIMTTLKLTFGVFLGSKIASWFHYPSIDIDFNPIAPWVIIITLPITALMFTVNFKAKRADWKWIFIAGIFGYFCSRLGTHYLGPELGIFFGGACVGAGSNLFARLMNRPSSLFHFPGIILLVPGSISYRSMSFLFEQDVMGGLNMAFLALAMAMSLVVGLFFGNILVKPRSSL
ncbi:MAG TPA: threonine/serine exporter family protein [Bacteriovoracaceae bacterium]|nr:threonine/serine exporter family protein [Bacteriovoracaceae bacterium]